MTDAYQFSRDPTGSDALPITKRARRWVAAKRVVFAILVMLGVVVTADAAPRKRVLIVGIDGTRTDALLAAETPNLDGLIKNGVLIENTSILGERKTASDTVSGPGWSSIVTGVWADKHGVKDNKFDGADYKSYPHFFRRVKDARPDTFTASIVTWAPIHDRMVTAADVSLVFKSDNVDEYAANDVKVADEAKKLLATKNPDALFLYFGVIDETGHKRGFHPSVPPYIAAIEQTDKHIGTVLDAVRSRPTYPDEDWLIIVCTDHGGRGTDHGKGHEFPEIRTVFLIVSGPSVAREKIDRPTYLVDVPVTALTHLGISIKPEWELDGRAVGVRP